MRNIKTGRSFVIILVLSCISGTSVLGRVHLVVMNGLGGGRVMNIHCRSRADDLGLLAIPNGFEMDWKFSVNSWGTPFFFCEVQWDGSEWHGFAAYSYERDSDRCRTECMWMVSKDGHLYGFNQQTGVWDLMPFQDGK